MTEDRFTTWAESCVYDNKFQTVLTREQAADMMNNLARELAEKIKQLEEK